MFLACRNVPAEDVLLDLAARGTRGKSPRTITLDVQGFYAAIQSVFDLHQTGHGDALSVSGYPVLTRLAEMKERIKAQ